MTRTMTRILSAFSLLTAPFPVCAQTSGSLQPNKNYNYEVDNIKKAKWTLEVISTSKYSSDGIPKKLSSQVKIEKKGSEGSHIYVVDIPNYPNENGVSYINVDNLEEPLFLVVSNSPVLPEGQKVVHLIAPKCKAPLASVRALIEDADQIQINTGVKDFMITFPSPEGTGKKTWTAPSDPSKLCSQKWR